MRRAKVYVNEMPAGVLEEIEQGKKYRFIYDEEYAGEPVSLRMPAGQKEYMFDAFPPFFDGLLPEGIMLDGLLKQNKIDKDDYFSQLITVGGDMVGAIRVEELK